MSLRLFCYSAIQRANLLFFMWIQVSGNPSILIYLGREVLDKLTFVARML